MLQSTYKILIYFAGKENRIEDQFQGLHLIWVLPANIPKLDSIGKRI